MQNSIQPFLWVRRAGIRRQLQSGGSSSRRRRRHMADMQINTRAAWIARFIFLFHLLPLFVPPLPGDAYTYFCIALCVPAWIHPLFLSRWARVFLIVLWTWTHEPSTSAFFVSALKKYVGWSARKSSWNLCAAVPNNDLFGSSPDFFAWSLADFFDYLRDADVPPGLYEGNHIMWAS